MENLSVAAVCMALFGFFFVSFKNWWSGRKVNQLSAEDKELFKNQEKVAASLQTAEKEFGFIPEQEAAKEDQQAIDEWNKQ